MECITFQSRWVEKCIRKVLCRQEGALCMEEISAIQYAKAGGDFMGGIVLELSTGRPPEPFAAMDGGDEWAFCLHSGTTVGENYRLEEYMIHEGTGVFRMEMGRVGKWDYSRSKEAEAAWSRYERSIVKGSAFRDLTAEELEAVKGDLLPLDDLSKLSGLKVFRLYEAEIQSAEWFRSFPKLEVLELAEVRAGQSDKELAVFAGLKQLVAWTD